MTIFDELQAANLPVISADESGAISMGAMTVEQQEQYHDIVMQHFQPALYADLQIAKAEAQQIKDAYQIMITRLEQIQNAGAIPFTSAGFNQVVQAVKDEALYIERIMKVIARLIT